MAGLEELGDYFRRGAAALGWDLDAPGAGIGPPVDRHVRANMAEFDRRLDAGTAATRKALSGAGMAPEDWAAMHDSPVAGFGTDAGGGAAGFAGMFLGRRALQANRAKLRRAQAMEAGPTAAERERLWALEDIPEAQWTPDQRAEWEALSAKVDPKFDPDLIRRETGWFAGPDGEWRFEISDRGAAIKTRPDGTEYLHHPELRRNYPGMVEGMRIERAAMPPDQHGSYNMRTGVFRLGNHVTDPKEALSVLLHELQHAVQVTEGFSTGANLNMAPFARMAQAERKAIEAQHRPAWDDYHKRFQDWIKANAGQWAYRRRSQGELQDAFDRTLDPADLDRYVQADRELGRLRNPYWEEQRRFELYEQAMGEYEAREVQRRMRLTADERAAIPPYDFTRQPHRVPFEDRFYPIAPGDLIDMRNFPGENGMPSKAAVQRIIKRYLGLSAP